MVTNRINKRGIYTEGTLDDQSINVFEGATTFSGSLSAPKKYEAYQATGSQAFTGDGIHSVVRINSGTQNVQHGLSLWNAQIHKFTPSAVGKIYHIRVDGILSSSTGTPFFHMDLELSGGIRPNSHHESASIHRQSVEVAVVRGLSYDHSHFHANFLLYSDEAMMVSGVQFYGAIDGNQTVTFKSASLMIFES